jgi:hypothetical protein
MRLLRCRVGPYDGQLIEYPEHVAENLLQNGLADEPSHAETAAFYGWGEAETATPPKAKAPGKKRKKKKA